MDTTWPRTGRKPRPELWRLFARCWWTAQCAVRKVASQPPPHGSTSVARTVFSLRARMRVLGGSWEWILHSIWAWEQLVKAESGLTLQSTNSQQVGHHHNGQWHKEGHKGPNHTKELSVNRQLPSLKLWCDRSDPALGLAWRCLQKDRGKKEVHL